MTRTNRLACALALALAACAEDLSVDNAADRWVDAECDREVSCRADGSLTKEDCLASRKQFGAPDRGIGGTSYGSLRAILDSARAQKVTVDWAKLQACLDAQRTRSCEAGGMLAPVPARLPSYLPCEEAFTGTLQAGARCITDAACAPRLACETSLSATCDGTCSALEAKECRRDVDCASGEICELYRCAAIRSPGAKGQPCGNFGACAAGLTCLSFTAEGGTIGSRCDVAPKVGEPCEFTCAASATCDPETKKCITPGAVGAACTKSFHCAWDLYCDTANGRCANLPESGPCVDPPEGSLGYARCDFRRAWCDESASPAQCVPHRGEGEPCPNGNECAPGLWCPSDVTPRTCAKSPPVTPVTICAP